MRTVIFAGLVIVASAADGRASQQALFEFHSVFWMNLHHFLHALARPAAPLSATLPASATAADRQQWAEALDHYRSQYGKRSLLFDDGMVRIREALGTAASGGSLPEATLDSRHRSVLEAAAPIYRKHWWTDHDGANREFIAALQQPLAQHGPAIATRLATSFDASWPQTPMRVDIVHDAGPPGNAYTISEPTLITIGVADSRHRGLAALELIFHEASHRWDAVLMNGVSNVASRLKVRAPRGLWHGLLFYNAGAITADVLANAGVMDYEMYMRAHKTFDLPGWHQSIARHWPAFLGGEISRDEAIARVLRDLL
jgi:hypothetical protein